jgi:arylesterase / paraoxonase
MWTGPDGERRLFVVNHRSEHDHTVEIFAYEGGRLTHAETIPGDAAQMHSPNDLVPVGPRTFYVTNYRGERSTFGRLREGLFRQPKSYVLFYDGAEYRRVAEGLRYANGINVSHDGRTVFVTTTLGREVLLYRREADGSLTPEPGRTITTGTGPDNLEVDANGDLWIGAHPSSFVFLQHAFLRRLGIRRRSPSQVIRIPHRDGEYGAPEVVYGEDGTVLSGSSVAAVYRDTLLIGSVFEGFLVCELRRQPS